MPLGGATKKLQKLVDSAEELYKRVNDLREEIEALRETLQATSEAVERLEADLDQQQALVEALAHERGIDVDRVLAEAAIQEAEPGGSGGVEKSDGMAADEPDGTAADEPDAAGADASTEVSDPNAGSE